MTKGKRAGGRATEAGMSFQATVGTWFAAQLVADMPLGSLFGLSADVRPKELQFETGDALDDITLRLTDGGAIYVQCKTRLSLGKNTNSPLGKTIFQLVKFLVQIRSANKSTSAHISNIAVLAISENAPRSLDSLEKACRHFDRGGEWLDVLSQVADDQRKALNKFEVHAKKAWESETGSKINNGDLVELARLLCIKRFGENETSRDWREASNLIGSRLFGREEDGASAMQTLLKTVRQLIQSGATADRAGLIRALRIAGHIDNRSPRFDEDITAIKKYTKDECERLKRHYRLPVGEGIPINRECLPALNEAINSGSLLVIGEPGAGKTGALVALAEQFVTQKMPFVFLSVDRLSRFTKLSDFKEELSLKNDLLDVLASWPGSDPGVIIIDALDASRGGASEDIISALIGLAVTKLGDRWSVIASIRTFDLMNGRKFREVMYGVPPNSNYAEPSLRQVRHFRIPRLTSMELDSLASISPKLNGLVDTAPPKLKDLLRNIFNLSLAAELIQSGVSSESIQTLTTQSELIDRYEDERLTSQPLKIAAAATISAMLEYRRLVVPQISVTNNEIDKLLQTGVLTKAGDLIAFSHHVLFDHIAGRFYLAWSDPQKLESQMAGDSMIGLLIGPAVRFAIERVWQNDVIGRPSSWKLLVGVVNSQNVDPVVVSIALRTLAERVESSEDIGELYKIINNAEDKKIGPVLSRLARFVSMSISERRSISAPAAVAWARLALQAASQKSKILSDGARFLLWALSERPEIQDTAFDSAFGLAARKLLELAWSLDPDFPLLTANAIRFVTKSYQSDIAASRSLLEQIFQEPRFTEHAHEEAPWLAEGIRNIIQHDPEFSAFIYATLFGREAPQDGTTWLGSHRSQILSLTSNRKQDYEHARWHLTQSLKFFLQTSPKAGTEAVVNAVIKDSDSYKGHEISEILTAGKPLIIIDDWLSVREWRDRDHTIGDTKDNILAIFVEFLQSCSPDDFVSVVKTVLEIHAGAGVWARILGIAAERVGIVDDLLWPIIVKPEFICIRGLARDAIICLAAIYSTRTVAERTSFENLALSSELFDQEEEKKWWHSLLERFLSLADENALATEEMKNLRLELQNKDQLQGNPPLMSFTTRWGSAENVTELLLKRSGVNIDQDPDKTIWEKRSVLEDVLKAIEKEATPEDLAKIWSGVKAVLQAISDANNVKPHEEMLHSSWGTISNAIERIVSSDLYDPNDKKQPDILAVLEVIETLSSSPYPEGGDNNSNDASSDMMAWGNWDVRVYAASSLIHLAPRFADQYPKIIDQLQHHLSDPVPTVRLKVAQAVNALWNINRERMWQLMELIAENEQSYGVLGFFISGPLMRISHADPTRCENFLSIILRRLGEKTLDEKRTRDTVREAAGNLIAHLYVRENNPNAWAWIELWGKDLVQGDFYFWTMLGALRSVFFFGYHDEKENADLAERGRAQAILNLVVASASTTIRTAKELLQNEQVSEVKKKEMEQLYRAGDHLLDQSCNQLYFGSGAFRSNTNDDARLMDIAGKKQFLADYRAVLDQIGQNGSARTVHHLIDLYTYLVDASPDTIFDQIAGILTGPAVEMNYQFESLGADALVALIRRYLADYRAIFDDSKRRKQLIDVLELFSSVGWPDALKLLYELPDLLR